MNYLPVSVLTTPSDPDSFLGDNDCTNGGVTATHTHKLCVPVEDGFLSLDDVIERGYVILELERSAIRSAPGHFKTTGETSWTMFGGNYVTSSDSRFNKAYGWSPIAVHDRVEGKRSNILTGTAIKRNQLTEA